MGNKRRHKESGGAAPAPNLPSRGATILLGRPKRRREATVAGQADTSQRARILRFPRLPRVFDVPELPPAS